MHDKKDILDMIVELGKSLDEVNKDDYIYITLDKAKYKSTSFSYVWDHAMWETEDERVRREYSEGKITEEDAFLELI